MKLIPTVPEYSSDTAAKIAWDLLNSHLKDDPGMAFYKHPNLGAGKGVVPDFVILTRRHGVIAVNVFREQISNIDSVDETEWSVNGKSLSAPLLELEDFLVAIKYQFNQQRLLRERINFLSYLSLPLITKIEFCAKFEKATELRGKFLWQDTESIPLTDQMDLTEQEWKLCQSVITSASEINGPPRGQLEKESKIGNAIRMMESSIAILDAEQTKASIQIPPGPQMIRGLAGTGKTVLLAMKAANIHARYPDKRILFTFNTQSLYNLVRTLITKFYRKNKICDPDWSMLHIRHGWGGKSNAGVYSDTCARIGKTPMTFMSAKSKSTEMPFKTCCAELLKHSLSPFYDYVLVDEAQDFPTEYFQVLWHLTAPPHAIYFAFDELQTLTSVELPQSDDLFGLDALTGAPRANLDGEYDGAIDKILVLEKSYRCPLPILMLAHGLGLGIHRKDGCLQMIFDRGTWESIGYEISGGALQSGHHVQISRPSQNSPSIIDKVYTGAVDSIEIKCFLDRTEELNWVSESIRVLIFEEKVSAENILVISLNARKAKDQMLKLQQLLFAEAIGSVIPGLLDGAAEFGEQDRVTLSTVFRAKGNEAPVVFIVGFESLNDYVGELETRNKAFTSISRSKGWLKISGIGESMKEVKAEMEKILSDIPVFKFPFPDKNQISRNLDPRETTRRRREIRDAGDLTKRLGELDDRAISALNSQQINQLIEKLQRVKGQKPSDE